MMPFVMDGAHIAWMALGWIIGFGFLVLLVWAIVRAIPPATDTTPESILKRRYASGEIDTDEYRRRLAELRRKGAA